MSAHRKQASSTPNWRPSTGCCRQMSPLDIISYRIRRGANVLLAFCLPTHQGSPTGDSAPSVRTAVSADSETASLFADRWV
jgi:hypothetical protein